jgi:hypothetical protein
MSSDDRSDSCHILIVVLDRPDPAGDEPFQAPDDLCFGLTFRCSWGSVRHGTGIPAQADHDNAPYSVIPLSVPAAIEPVTALFTARSVDGACAGSRGERGVGGEPLRVVTDGGHDRPDDVDPYCGLGQ